MKRHDADAISLVFGLIFLGLAAGWALVRVNLVGLADLQLAGAILLVAAGAIGLVVSLRRGRRSADRQQTSEGTDEGPDEGPEETRVLGRPDETP